MENSDDKKIRANLAQLAKFDSSYWEFRRQAKREGMHGIIQYPAMMVPQMQGALLGVFQNVRPDINRVLDPFSGSGTSMTESMLRGLNFTGFDINPLAILICTAKSNTVFDDRFFQKISELETRINTDKGMSIDVAFAGRSKWFTRSASIYLSRIRRAIIDEPDQNARRYFWVIFAETIRQTSNSRTSTYKLHVRSDEQMAKIKRPTEIFLKDLSDAKNRADHQLKALTENNLLSRGRYNRKVSLHCEDILTSKKGISGLTNNLMVTSPPYGDNRSTIPYGQFSFLALNWIPISDLPGNPALSEHTYAIDTASLGGRTAYTQEKCICISAISPTFRRYINELKKNRRADLDAKVINFVYDLFEAVQAIFKRMQNQSYLAWTLANRTVSGLPVPLVEICKEFHLYFHATHVTTVVRKIPSKRTPNRNSFSNTMREEKILILRSP